jgi:hypothetical protein
MHRLPSNAGQRHLTGKMKNDDVAAFRHDRIRKQFWVLRQERSTRQVISVCAIEPLKVCGENPKSHGVAPARPKC